MSASQLASLLVRDEKVGAARMAEAFQRQVIFGGALDTSLLELGFVDAATLAEYLVRASGLPFLDELPPWSGDDRAFDAPTAERLVAVPLGRAKDGRCNVLLVEPDDEKLADLAQVVGGPVAASVGLEVRVRQALAERYGVELSRRYVKLAKRVADSGVAVPYRIAAKTPVPEPSTSVAPAPGASSPAAASRAPRAARLERHLVSAVEAFAEPPRLEEFTAALGRTPVVEPAPSAEPAAPPASAPALPPALPLSLDEGLEALQQAADRDAVFSLICQVARSQFAFAALFGVQGKTAKARTAMGEAFVDRDALAATAVDLREASPLRTVAQTLAPFVGRLGDEPMLGGVLSALGRRGPVPGALLPVALGGRVIALLLVENGGQPAGADGLAVLTRLCAEAATAFRRIIEAGRSGQTPPGGTPLPTRAPSGRRKR